jgi:hypothetical protein
MHPRSTAPGAGHEPCAEPADAYVVLRERGVTKIADAVSLLCTSDRPTLEEFDVVADGLGLYLYQLELERTLPDALEP